MIVGSHDSPIKIGRGQSPAIPATLTIKTVTIVRLVLAVLSLSCFLLLSAQQNSQPARAAKGDVKRGKVIFASTCEECHNPTSKDSEIGPGLQGIGEGKLPDGNAATAERLLDIINRGPAEMPSFKDKLTEQEKADVVAFVLTL